MKLALKNFMQVDKSSIYPRLYGRNYLVTGAVITAVLFVASVLLSWIPFSCTGEFTRYVCGVKYEQYRLSQLEVNDIMVAFIFLSNVTVLIAPLLMIPVLEQEKLRKVKLTRKWKIKAVLWVLGGYLFLLPGSFGAALALPYPQTEYFRNLSFNSQLAYMLTCGVAIVNPLLVQYGLYCYLKALYSTKQGESS